MFQDMASDHSKEKLIETSPSFAACDAVTVHRHTKFEDGDSTSPLTTEVNTSVGHSPSSKKKHKLLVSQNGKSFPIINLDLVVLKT